MTSLYIVYHTKDFYVGKVPTGYELYANGATAATRIGRYGRELKYLTRAIADCDKRQADHDR